MKFGEPKMEMSAAMAPEKTSYEDRLMKKLRDISPDGNYSEDIIKKTLERMEQEHVTFHVAEHGLETSVAEVLSLDEMNDRKENEFEPNMNWYSVSVRNEADKNRWIELRNEWLMCAWSPNQDAEERLRNADRMREIEKELRSLEQK